MSSSTNVPCQTWALHEKPAKFRCEPSAPGLVLHTSLGTFAGCRGIRSGTVIFVGVAAQLIVTSFTSCITTQKKPPNYLKSVLISNWSHFNCTPPRIRTLNFDQKNHTTVVLLPRYGGEKSRNIQKIKSHQMKCAHIFLTCVNWARMDYELFLPTREGATNLRISRSQLMNDFPSRKKKSEAQTWKWAGVNILPNHCECPRRRHYVSMLTTRQAHVSLRVLIQAVDIIRHHRTQKRLK